MITLENIKAQEQQIKNLENSLRELQGNINQSRKIYSQLVEAYYNSAPPFPRNRPDSLSNFSDDISQFQQIIAHSLRSGNDGLLKKWLIQPIRDRKLSILARRNKIKDYVVAIDNLMVKPASDTERACLKQIKEAFLSLRELNTH